MKARPIRMLMRRRPGRTVPADRSAPRPGRCVNCTHTWLSTRKPGDPFEVCPRCGSDAVIIGPHPPKEQP